MRNRWGYFRPILDYLGLLAWVFGLLMVVPLTVRWLFARGGVVETPALTFGVPAAVGLLVGLLLKRNLRFPPLDNRRAMILCALAWIVISAIGALPFWMGLPCSYLDAYFETVSGFTTTGITVFTDLHTMPGSILFWRSFIQWLGGLGILTLFLAILYTGGSAHRLFSAESHKVFARRPAPGLFSTLRILWIIYAGLTAATALALIAEGMGGFDAVCHAMTALSTGGYSPHDTSIGFYRAGGGHFVLMEYTLICAMFAGGVNFFVHYRLLCGSWRALFDSLEMRIWWSLLAGATALVMVNHYAHPDQAAAAGAGAVAAGTSTLARFEEVFRTSLFQVVSIATTTGFATEDIGSDYFPAASKLVFLILMVVGGCVGSTGGGIKVLRMGVLAKMINRQIRKLIFGPATVHPVAVDGQQIDGEELRRVAALFFAWMALLAVGAIVTAMLSNHDALASASGMFSALGNIGPCYIPTPAMGELHPVTKLVYIVGMLAGRLEILPLLLLFSRRTWR